MNNPESVGIRMRNSCAFNVSALASYDLGRTGDIAYIFYAKASIGVIYSNGEGDSIRFDSPAPRGRGTLRQVAGIFLVGHPPSTHLTRYVTGEKRKMCG